MRAGRPATAICKPIDRRRFSSVELTLPAIKLNHDENKNSTPKVAQTESESNIFDLNTML